MDNRNNIIHYSMESKDMKHLYRVHDYFLQDWVYCYAYSLPQAKVLLRNQILRKIGKYAFNSNIEIVKE
jgi:hypothetical protein